MLPARVLILAPFRLVQKLGWKEGLTQGLRYVLRKKYVVFHYPDSSRNYTVYYSFVWKYMEMGTSADSGSIQFLRGIVKPGCLVMDIGANVGQYTLLLSELVGKTGKVIAFEPDPINRDILQSNLSNNNVNNVVVEAKAVSNKRGTSILSSKSFGSVASSIVRYSRDSGALQSVQVNSIGLDEYCQEQNLCPGGVNVDVEGAEGLVLDGMNQILSRCKPWVHLELHGSFLDRGTVERIWGRVRKGSKRIIFMGGDELGYKLGERVEWEVPPLNSHFRILILF
jgi:FkbM family methyltransferase